MRAKVVSITGPLAWTCVVRKLVNYDETVKYRLMGMDYDDNVIFKFDGSEDKDEQIPHYEHLDSETFKQ